jgi:formimidoylglutamate deiminase
LLEYGQRLALRQRNVSADPATNPGTAARLVDRCLTGGAAAVGQSNWGLVAGGRADLLVLNESDPALIGLPASHLLDGLIFAAPAQPFARVMVSGRWIPRKDTAAMFTTAMRALWA